MLREALSWLSKLKKYLPPIRFGFTVATKRMTGVVDTGREFVEHCCCVALCFSLRRNSSKLVPWSTM